MKEKYPNILVVICGANPTPKVKSLQGENVIVTGWVDDIRSFYAQSRIFIAPMRLGTGLQNKLLEAMAINIPFIASPLASEPLNAEKDKEIIVCKVYSVMLMQLICYFLIKHFIKRFLKMLFFLLRKITIGNTLLPF